MKLAYRVCAPAAGKQLYERFGSVFTGVEERAKTALLNFEFVWQNSKGGVSRYSDGNFPVLYSAETVEVAIIEKGYWVREILFRPLQENVTLEPYVVYTVRLTGLSREISAEDNPMIVHPNDYTICNEIGRQAWEGDVAFLVVPSARCFDGVCIPIFDRESASLNSEVFYDVSYAWNSSENAIISLYGGSSKDIEFDDVYGKFTGQSQQLT